MPASRSTQPRRQLAAAWAFALLVAAASAGLLVVAKADPPEPGSVEQILKLRRPAPTIDDLP